MKKTAKKLRVSRETIRQLSNIQLEAAYGGLKKLSAPTDEMGECGTCGTLYGCNTREDRDCWTTYGGCPG